MNPILVMCRRARIKRINRLVSELEGYEAAMLDRCHQILELCDTNDDLHVSVRRLIEALEDQP